MATQTLLKPAATADYWSQGLRKKFKDHGLRLEAVPVTAPEPYVDLDYEHNKDKADALSATVLKRSDLEKTLPGEFPAKLEGPLCWSGSQGPVPREEDYVVHLTGDDLVEINEALTHFKSLNLEPKAANPSNFPLPNLSRRLEGIRQDVYYGRGFSILRGLDVDSYSDVDLASVTFGITSLVAPIRGKQDQDGSMIMHVQNRDEADKEHNKTVQKPFHTDTVTDVLVLVTKECAAQGGSSILTSGWTVYNELAATRPDIIHTLSKNDWPFDTYKRQPLFYMRPLLFWAADKLIWSFSRRLLTGSAPHSPRTKGIPGLNVRQADALNKIHEIGVKHEIKTEMKKGDIRFLNNMGVLHRRESFEDDGKTERHLLRLWLNNPDHCWPLPKDLQAAWARVFDDPERGESYHYSPVKDDKGRILRVAGSCD